jgi:hypothetical protein
VFSTSFNLQSDSLNKFCLIFTYYICLAQISANCRCLCHPELQLFPFISWRIYCYSTFCLIFI